MMISTIMAIQYWTPSPRLMKKDVIVAEKGHGDQLNGHDDAVGRLIPRRP